ncbi:3-oxoacyl-[acyl-carrier-protein] synthase 3 [Planctomycetales bacterium]|jgi:3-oxoacyl-[acyl-carrier-protein] synthase-3|nr:ketoacyl-ACP synthase III [Planctomycetota bacterium]GHS92428.1 3-oxoacyl-[acyl-carrier-protein] synthase 3 [Planctomycetales bacterium]GHT00507.1 3-oxoacyl-[acyl-carrier-protein] synthase 3 [Planctomycetales bacterium]GHT03263.1 3-oxoacyl-[acyl-carrier-protein] synthase 3 [Planctomycetales bacterium]GHV19907.1 3-oxoacyl-[acyl-carrier-protein] synthase 3 [Planctomycetales bacterium]
MISSTKLRQVKIVGTGSYLPEKRLANVDLEKMVETNDEWIVQRTGMRERRVAAPDEATSDLCINAARRALDNAKMRPEDIDMIIVATVTPDSAFPSTACRVQHAIGAREVPSFDLSAACSGFIFALSMARTQIASGVMNNILICGGEVLTRFVDYTDRGTCILFGDGAGAAILSPADDDDKSHIIDTHMASNGAEADMMILPGGGSRIPPSAQMLADRKNFIAINGRAVYMQAVSRIVKLVGESLDRCGLKREDIDTIIPHQMNARIIESAAKRLEIPLDKIFMNLDKYGNTSAATIPIALDEANRQGVIKRGDLVSLVAFGGGLTWASALLRW